MLGEELVTVVRAAAEKRLGARAVTNGFWARTPRHAESWVARLYDAGFRELNLSTGDDHPEWVPFESDANAALAAASVAIIAAVNVEEHDGARFRAAGVLHESPIRFFLDHHPNHHLLIVTGGLWLSLRSVREFAYSPNGVCEALKKQTLGTPFSKIALASKAFRTDSDRNAFCVGLWVGKGAVGHAQGLGACAEAFRPRRLVDCGVGCFLCFVWKGSGKLVAEATPVFWPCLSWLSCFWDWWSTRGLVFWRVL